MTRFEPGDVVLVRFPFTDLRVAKQRPTVVISPPGFSDRYGDVVLLALTSQPQPEDDLRLRDWQSSHLPKPTWCKPLVATLSLDLVLKRLGRLSRADRSCVACALRWLIDDRFASNIGP